MFKFIQKFLVFAVCLGLGLPGGFFVSANENYSTNAQSKSNSLFSAKVVSFGPMPQVLVASSKPMLNSVCTPTPIPENSLLGGNSDLNLNQPANCFKIVQSDGAIYQNLNIVDSFKVIPKITVLGTGNFFLKPALASSLPKLPEATEILIAVGLFAAVFSTKKSVQYALAQKPENFVFKPGIFELQVLRC